MLKVVKTPQERLIAELGKTRFGPIVKALLCAGAANMPDASAERVFGDLVKVRRMAEALLRAHRRSLKRRRLAKNFLMY